MPQHSRSQKRAQIIHQGSGKKAKLPPATAAATSPVEVTSDAVDVTQTVLAGVAEINAPSNIGGTSNSRDVALPTLNEVDQEAEMQLIEVADGTAPDEMEIPGDPHSTSEGKKHKGKKHKKEKVVRDSFTMPRNDYEKIAELKKKVQHLGLSAKKSEVLRAGLHALEQLTPEQLKQVIEGVEKVKTGRPG